MVLLGFEGIWAVWGLGTQIQHLSFSIPPKKGPFYTPKTRRFKGKMPNFGANKKLYK